MLTSQIAPCTYEHLPNGVHQIVMHASSRAAVDMWLNHMTDLMYDLYVHGDNTYAPVLLDLRQPGMMPVGYATFAVRLWASEYTHPPMIDLAVVYRYGLLGNLALAFADLSRLPDGVRLFHKGRYDDALTWLTYRASTLNNGEIDID